MENKRVTSLRDLPQKIEPTRNLWPEIEAALKDQAREATGQGRRWPRLSRTQAGAAAAVISSMAVGIWIGSTLPRGDATVKGIGAPDALTASSSTPEAVPTTAFVTDPRYLHQRAALIRSHEARLASLPPETRAKVSASLAAIRQSMKDIEDALGRDPSNALLQELLVNTYQDEMRVLTTVQEASAREI